jgi:hypothetical protein
MNHLFVQTTTDGEEGRRAFNEKRQPKFTGRLRRCGEPFGDFTSGQLKRLFDLHRQGDF